MLTAYGEMKDKCCCQLRVEGCTSLSPTVVCSGFLQIIYIVLFLHFLHQWKQNRKMKILFRVASKFSSHSETDYKSDVIFRTKRFSTQDHRRKDAQVADDILSS